MYHILDLDTEPETALVLALSAVNEMRSDTKEPKLLVIQLRRLCGLKSGIYNKTPIHTSLKGEESENEHVLSHPHLK